MTTRCKRVCSNSRWWRRAFCLRLPRRLHALRETQRVLVTDESEVQLLQSIRANKNHGGKGFDAKFLRELLIELIVLRQIRAQGEKGRGGIADPAVRENFALHFEARSAGSGGKINHHGSTAFPSGFERLVRVANPQDSFLCAW